MSLLIDSFGRQHRDLRVSLTDRCNLRCSYCMPHDLIEWLPGDRLLSTEELMTVISVAVECGVTGIRLTGGEPLLRGDVVDIVARIAALPNPPKIALTTYGLRLPALAGPLRDAGLERVNISLDTLD
ncbi:MAG: radical SAM protein, partial [Actinomycetales bacterium]